jgi:tRNA pseudouridine55 synthase
MPSGFDFIKGEYLLIDKPILWTSFDVVNKIRYLLKIHLKVKDIKVGHAGTLDPLATGLVIVCTGAMTKKIDSLTILDKEYTGTITLGATRPSFDMETDIDQTFDFSDITSEDIERVRLEFLGEILQTPPIYSAKKIEGRRAYEFARKSRKVHIEGKMVTIDEFDIEKIRMPDVFFHITCSKGTYIRSIASDFGKKLNNGSYLYELRRTKIGSFDVEDAISIEQFEFMLKSSLPS